MSAKASDYRRAGRRYAQDKARNARRREVERAENAYDEAYEAYFYGAGRDEPRHGAGPRPYYEAYRAANAALDEVDPTNTRFS